MKHDINNILKDLKIPEPEESSKRATIKAALMEFNQQEFASEKKIKGLDSKRRLKGTLLNFVTFLGEIIMKKPFVVSSAVAFVVFLVFGLSYYTLFNHYATRQGGSFDDVAQAIQEEIKKSRIIVAQNDLDMEGRAKNERRRENFAVVGEKGSFLDSMAAETGRSDVSLKEGNYLAKDSRDYKEDIESLPESGKQSKPESVEQEYKTDLAGGSTKKENIAPAKRKLAAIKSLSKGFAASRRMSVSSSIIPAPADDRLINKYKEVGRDKFDGKFPNPIKQVVEEPVSTFSIDVDTSSYAFIRRQLNNGVLPQKDAVRIEEMINYFDYDYPVPSDKLKPFEPTIAVYPSPWNKNTKLMHIGIKCYDQVQEERPKANLVFLIDVSGSMNSNDKLPLLKNSLRLMVNSMVPDDTVAIVVYAGAAGTVLEPTSIKDKGNILNALESLSAGGSTAGGEGIKRAYDLAEANFDKEGVNRVILATDGDFNVGIRDPEELKSYIERKRETGIFLSTLGFGQGNYNDALMQKLAQNGNGNAAYIDTLNEARKVLVEEAGATLFTVARDVKIQIEFNPEQVSEYRLIGYESRMLREEDFNNDKVDAGDIGSGHSVTAIYEITPVGSSKRFVDELRYSDNKIEREAKSGGFNKEYGFLKIRYKLPGKDQSSLITTPVNVKNEYNKIDKAPDDVQFACSVSAFGQLLRGGTYIGEFDYEDIIRLAKSSTGNDPFGYRHEFLNMVRLAKSIK